MSFTNEIKSNCFFLAGATTAIASYFTSGGLQDSLQISAVALSGMMFLQDTQQKTTNSPSKIKIFLGLGFIAAHLTNIHGDSYLNGLVAGAWFLGSSFRDGSFFEKNKQESLSEIISHADEAQVKKMKLS